MVRLRLRSSSLLEVIVAMIILSIVYSFAMMFFTRIISRGALEVELEYHNELRQVSSKVVRGGTLSLDSTQSYVTQNWHGGSSTLKIVSVQKIVHNQTVEINRLCIIED